MYKLGLALLLCLLLGAAQAQSPVIFPAPIGPAGSIPLVASTTGTTASITATLTGAAGQYTYVCGFIVTSAGTTSAASANVTLTGTKATMNFTYVFVSSGQGVLGAALGPGCITSSAVNTNIVLTVPGGGAGTTVAATIWGYRN